MDACEIANFLANELFMQQVLLKIIIICSNFKHTKQMFAFEKRNINSKYNTQVFSIRVPEIHFLIFSKFPKCVYSHSHTSLQGNEQIIVGYNGLFLVFF